MIRLGHICLFIMQRKFSEIIVSEIFFAYFVLLLDKVCGEKYIRKKGFSEVSK